MPDPMLTYVANRIGAACQYTQVSDGLWADGDVHIISTSRNVWWRLEVMLIRLTIDGDGLIAEVALPRANLHHLPLNDEWSLYQADEISEGMFAMAMQRGNGAAQEIHGYYL